MQWPESSRPLLGASRVVYEVAAGAKGTVTGGIAIMHSLAVHAGLVEAINNSFRVFKRWLPYSESDHVLSIAYNHLCGGTTIEDMQLRRQDEGLLGALGVSRLPSPAASGDFTRRLTEENIERLMDGFNLCRVKFWKQQPDEFFDEAIIEGDGTIVPTTGECKQGMDVSYKGIWGYHPLIISLANTQEPLFLVNRPGNRPSSEGAAGYFDRAMKLCREAGFRSILLRGDTDFSQTAQLDRWDSEKVRFLFGFNAMKGVQARAKKLPESAWKRLDRPPKYAAATKTRKRPRNVKKAIVREREYRNIRLNHEHVAEFDYQPNACEKPYRMIVLRKNLSIERGENALIPDIRYFFYITNDRRKSAARLVLLANQRCNQENLIDQLKNGVRAMRMPTDGLASNWAYMVMASLAWTLKAWFALGLPAKGRWKAEHASDKAEVLKMGFKKFFDNFILVPAQFVRTGRRKYLRLLGWNPWLHVFLRGANAVEAAPL